MSNRFKFRIPYYKENMFVGFVTANVATGESSFIQGCSPKEPEQCTGLKDKNGKLIYEGDIVECSYKNCSKNGVIKWDDICLCFYIECEGKGYEFTPYSENDELKIVGNIHENGDLLK